MHPLKLHSEQALMPQLAALLPTVDADLSQILCVLPNDFLIPQLQQQLKGERALLLPRITTLQEISASYSSETLPSHQCKLLLAQLLKNHRHLYGKGSHWGLANNLLQLFDELSLQSIDTNMSWEDFKTSISKSDSANTHPWFNREAQLVFTLWQAWHQQMRAEGWLDPASAYAAGLQQHSQQASPFKHLVFVQPNQLRQCEARWLKALNLNTFVADYPESVSKHSSRLTCAPCQSCLLYTSPSPRDQRGSRMPSSA